ncbi:hypothetical protein F7725_000083 [Dissostichus mawsoni]|uniref:Uncharacterized protein n=1 Tax=Dissostichus mawsoni TaxID=36200 RepID=A0A7J5ZHE9_DISMA|nr:hypothetical protein F7725_000083 [Dissostichus mawsoni]
MKGCGIPRCFIRASGKMMQMETIMMRGLAGGILSLTRCASAATGPVGDRGVNSRRPTVNRPPWGQSWSPRSRRCKLEPALADVTGAIADAAPLRRTAVSTGLHLSDSSTTSSPRANGDEPG